MSYTSVTELDLSPKPCKHYWSEGYREWREEFIYFLLIDRFHDSMPRTSVGNSSSQGGYGDHQQLQTTCVGSSITSVTSTGLHLAEPCI